MLRRLIIRSFFMVPILLCLCMWGWSCSHWTWIEYYHHDCYVACESVWGSVEVQWLVPYAHADGWSCVIVPKDNAYFLPDFREVDSFLGFRYRHWDRTTTTLHHLRAPWWFLIVVFSAILYLVWHMTRPRRAGRAFPVTLAALRSDPDGKTP